jgi:C4-dicarboxylate-binding protein DctP
MAAAAFGAVLIGSVHSAFAQDPIVIKFSHVVAAESAKGKAAEYFKKLAEERTKGAVKVEVYHNSTLYKDKEELDALQMGAVQMLAPTPGKFGPLGVRDFEMLDLPYLFDSLEQEHKVTQGPVGQGMLKKLESKGVLGLAFWDNGFKQMTSNKPIVKPDDFRGQKLRIQPSKVIDAQMRALGALPQVTSFAELYQALQTGVVDGQENPANVIYPSKLYEAQKYLTVSDHGYHGYVVITNARFWASLPPDIRSVLEGAMRDTTTYFNDSSKRESDDALEAIRKSGKTEVHVLSADEKRAWKKALIRVHRDMGEKLNKPLLESIYRETGVDPEKP